MRTKIVGLLAVAFSLGFAQAASAADLPVKAPVAIAVYNWTGCYVGANAGGKWGRFKETDTTPSFTFLQTPFAADFANPDNATGSSVVAGGQVGCRYQTAQRWVLGIEGDSIGRI